MAGNKKKKSQDTKPGTKKIPKDTIKKINTKKSNNKPKSANTEFLKSDNREIMALERNDVPMSIVGHLNELRSRLIISLVTVTIVTLTTFFFFSDYILNIINKPYIKTGLKLNVFTLSEGFIIRVKVSIITGILAGFPVIIYEIWKYIVPAIGKKDRKFIGRSTIAVILLMYSGIIFTYLLLLPITIRMLLSITPDNMNNIIGANKYLNFAAIFSFAMGLVFELPILIMILTKIGIITPKLLISKRKYAIVIIWILAAIVTPGPDIFTQAMVAVPVMLLYEISIIISKIMIKRKLKQG